LVVVGIAPSNQYSLQPTVFVPHLTYEKIRPRASDRIGEEAASVTFNVALVKLNNPADAARMAQHIERTIADGRSIVREPEGVLAISKQTAWENTPGYSAQQSTLGLQRVFTLLIGLLVVGSFFRIQAAQKIAQVGVLKAIGTSNSVIGTAALLQIFLVNAFGVALGAALTYGLSLAIPPVVPVRFDGASAATAVALMLLIGPLGGLVAVRALLKAEPLKALGLAA
jgi:putative ABC transport system permease protein